ncbi:hypothetical protein, partial [Klebsiella pneumoniae]|uniref:hypothetical protein n=1 Tax=Klebsiella pneumoniae TaxID=573 RepID=UPI001954B622
VVENGGAPYANVVSNAATTGIYTAFNLHVWQSQTASEWMRLSSAALAMSVPIQLKAYTVATLPAGVTGQTVWCS